jgi:predicted MPP superfamily phosphohydrolase
MITRRRFLRWSAAAAGLGLGVGFYTWRLEPHWVEVVERRLPIVNLPDRLAGAQLVQLSDLHGTTRRGNTCWREVEGCISIGASAISCGSGLTCVPK